MVGAAWESSSAKCSQCLGALGERGIGRNAASDLRCSSWRLSANYTPHGGRSEPIIPRLPKPTSGKVFKSSPNFRVALFISLGSPFAIS